MKVKRTILEINAYDTPLFEDEGYLKLESNENDFGPSSKVLEAIRNTRAEDLKFYPLYGKLIQKLAVFHKVRPENIILTAGCDEAINAVFGTFLEAGDTILTVKPSFVMPKLYSKIQNLNYKEIPYEEKWIFPTNQFIENINEEVDLIHLTTPNSPTGETISKPALEKIIEASEKRAIVIDETYANWASETNTKLIHDMDNVFILRSFSKDFALAGLRLGYVISDEKNILMLRKYLSPYNVSSLSVIAGIAALDDLRYFEKVKIELEKSKDFLALALRSFGAKVYPSRTNFLCVDFGIKADFVNHKFLESKIKTRYFGRTPMLEDTFRITVPKIENAHKVVKSLELKPTIIFDMDGVLIDASKSYRIAIQKTYKDFSGKDVSFEKIQAIKNQGGFNNDWDLTEFLLTSQKIEVEKSKIIETFNKHYWDGDKGLIYNEELLVTKEFIQNLAKNYNLAIFTGRCKNEAIFALERFGILENFHPIITMDDLPIDKQKPHPLGLEMIKERILSKEIFYLGDTIDDMISANKAGVNPIGILPPQDKSEELKALLKSQNPMVILNQALDIKEWLDEKLSS